jgi:hypothetical protein
LAFRFRRKIIAAAAEPRARRVRGIVVETAIVVLLEEVGESCSEGVESVGVGPALAPVPEGGSCVEGESGEEGGEEEEEVVEGV